MKKYLLLLFIALTAAVSASAANAAQWAPKENELWIGVNKEQLRLTLYGGYEPVKTFQVSIGRGRGTVKKSREDLITPSGTFTIYRVIEDATKLVYDPAWFNEEGEPQEGVYGAKLISFYNKWQIAIHGTNNPGSVGKRATHGCIRLRNPDIINLAQHVKKGMKLVIVEKNEDMPFYKETI